MAIDTSQLNLQELGQHGYRLTPATLAQKTTGGMWVPARHLTYISSIVASAISKGGARLTISIPPRHGKSEFCSVHTPIWVMENFPRQHIILASYGADLSTDFSRRVRDTFLDPDLENVLQTRLDQNSRQTGRFHTEQNGAMFAMGLSGAITGRGANLLLVDDYLKNADESLSASQRDKVFETFRSTVFTRLEPGASVIIVATRWHPEDLIGKIHAEWPNRWQHIELPALAREDDPLGREVGEPLWPQRFSRDNLLEIKDTLGTYWWEALYQQRPMASMSSVNLAEQLKVIDYGELPSFNHLLFLRAWDLAASESKGDWSVGFLLAAHKDTGHFFIVDITRFRKSPAGTKEMIKTVAERDGKGVPIEIEQEPGSSGKSYIEHLKGEVLQGHSVRGERPTGPLEVRASPLLAAIEAGRCSMVRADWNDEFLAELAAFPNGDHDDQIAAGAIAFRRLDKNRFGGAVWGRGKAAQQGSGSQPRAGSGQKGKGYKTGIVWR